MERAAFAQAIADLTGDSNFSVRVTLSRAGVAYRYTTAIPMSADERILIGRQIFSQDVLAFAMDADAVEGLVQGDVINWNGVHYTVTGVPSIDPGHVGFWRVLAARKPGA